MTALFMLILLIVVSIFGWGGSPGTYAILTLIVIVVIGFFFSLLRFIVEAIGDAVSF